MNEEEFYTVENRFKWEKKELERWRRTLKHNIIKGLPGLGPPANEFGKTLDPNDLWNLQFLNLM